MSSHQFSPPSLVARLRSAFTLGGGVYPLKGFFFFLTHPYLYPLLRARLLPCFLLSIFVLSTLFIWTYLPQVALLALFHGRASAWFNGTVLVLGESAAIVALLFEAWFADEAQVDIFDAVLVAKGCEDLVARSRPVLPSAAGVEGEEALNPRTRLGKPLRSAVYAPFSFRQIVEFIVFLPLNFLPWIGVPLFLFLTGYRAGPLQHWRYFKLKGMDRKQRNAFIEERRWMYTWFGTVALVLQLVPVFSMLFLLTTAGGSALWAARLEEANREEASDAVQGEYADDPV